MNADPTNPGAVTGERARVEAAVARRITPAVARFVAEVSAEARASYRTGGALTAAGTRRRTLTLGMVSRAWADKVAPAVTAAVTEALGDTEGAATHLRSLARRLATSTVPSEVFTAYRDALVTARGEAMPFTTVNRQVIAPLTRSLQDSIVTSVARTESTAVYNMAVIERLVGMGYTTKMWVAHHDGRTRPTHLEADRQQAPILGDFRVGGFALVMPGDPTAPLQETANCRCVLVGVRRDSSTD